MLYRPFGTERAIESMVFKVHFCYLGTEALSMFSINTHGMSKQVNDDYYEITQNK